MNRNAKEYQIETMDITELDAEEQAGPEEMESFGTLSPIDASDAEWASLTY